MKADPNSEASDAVAEQLVNVNRVTVSSAGPGHACSACGELATQKVGYGSPVWGWNFSCSSHSAAFAE